MDIKQYTDRLLAALCVRIEHVEIVKYSGEHEQRAILPWTCKFNNRFFDAIRARIFAILMSLARLGMINDIVIFEILPQIYTSHVFVAKYGFHPDKILFCHDGAYITKSIYYPEMSLDSIVNKSQYYPEMSGDIIINQPSFEFSCVGSFIDPYTKTGGLSENFPCVVHKYSVIKISGYNKLIIKLFENCIFVKPVYVYMGVPEACTNCFIYAGKKRLLIL